MHIQETIKQKTSWSVFINHVLFLTKYKTLKKGFTL